MKRIKLETREHKVIGRAPAGDQCFGCRTGPSEALGIRVYRMDDGSVVSIIHTNPTHESFQGIVHGGIICSYLDEVLSYNTWSEENYDAIAMTKDMKINYLAPVPTDADIRVVGDPPEIDGRYYTVKGRIILPDDTVAATAEIHYVKLHLDDERNLAEDHEHRSGYAEPRETIRY